MTALWRGGARRDVTAGDGRRVPVVTGNLPPS